MNTRQQLNTGSNPANRLPVTECDPKHARLYKTIVSLAEHDVDSTEYVLLRALAELIGDSIPLISGAKVSKAPPTKSWLLKGRSAKDDWHCLGFDHRIPLILADGSRAILGEPYDLHCIDFDEIESLRSEGFRVTVSGRSQHYPAASSSNHTHVRYTDVCLTEIIYSMINQTIRTDTPITPRQRDVLNYIGEHIHAQGYPPSIREVAARFGYSSTRTAADLIDALHAKGHIRRARGVARSIQLTNRDTAA